MSAIGSISGMGGAAMPQVVSGASMRMPPSQKMSNLFQQIDTSGTGSITKAQFDQAFQTLNPPKGFQQMGSNSIWSQLDPNGTGSVSKQDFINTMTSLMSQVRHNHHNEASGNSAAQTLSASTHALNSLGTPPAAAPIGAIGNHVNTSA
ncbi:MAG TPA: EF-hand domain-containing protein [Gallionella sp.]|nr:EF-hand domain-containing protein [Gallionella sp.]